MEENPRGRLLGASRRLLRDAPGLSPALLIVALLACVLVPLPQPVVDLLLSLSLAGAVLLMVASLRIRRTTDFLSFPSLLLLITLFRLALNVSTTRLILSEADAGTVIDAFAGFVIRGDLIVGAVMFIIITVIQYVVIARGAERVAEVGARFALDGMPGAQAAIEADLKSGAISVREAAQRRATLTERSNFYGAMDGAVRFVKGDAIAGLLITGINIVGGLGIGMGRQGMSLAESLSVYVRLTVGDGLLAQIPALLVSLGAALLVARVDRESETERPRWLEPAALLVPALLLVALAVIPGMPRAAFAVTGVGLIATAVVLTAVRPPTAPAAAPQVDLELVVNAAHIDTVKPRVAEDLRARCEDALGIALPTFRLCFEETAEGLELRFGGRILHRRRDLEIDEASLLLEGFRAVMNRAELFVDLPTIEEWIEHERLRSPGLVKEALTAVQLGDVLRIVRALVRERIPVPPMDVLLGILAERRVFREEAERERWPDRVREGLATYWVHGLLDGVSSVGHPRWVRPTPDLELRLESTAERGDGDPYVRMSVAERTRWTRALLSLPGAAPDANEEGVPRHPTRPVIVLTGSRARAAFASLLRGSTPHVPVVSRRELAAAGVREPLDFVFVDEDAVESAT